MKLEHDEMPRSAQHGTDERGAERAGISSISVLFGRLMWFIIGPLVLIFVTYGIVTNGDGWLTGKNATYLVSVALMVWGRWVEQRSGCATLADGKPATWEHFRRYVRYMLPGAAVVWLAANVVGNHVLGGD